MAIRLSLGQSTALLSIATALVLCSATARAGACREAAKAQRSGCLAEAAGEHHLAGAVCSNGPSGQQGECNADARADRQEARELCRAQFDARVELCEVLGEGRYAPDLDPSHFDPDPADPSHPNPYFPLAVGNRWEYAGAGELDVVEVTSDTKRIDGLTCLVVNDRVSGESVVVEDTDDWFARRKDGAVVYCGEEVKDYETFAGDDPVLPELVSIEGSFKAGRDGALPGTQFLAAPQVGAVYRQEWSPNTAEDAARVLSTRYEPGSDPELDAHVPRALADLLCDGDCVVTLEFTPIEPDSLARKYYARGIGLFLEVDVESGDALVLVGCNVDARCGSLPSPR
jgi:hypothetical protein